MIKISSFKKIYTYLASLLVQANKFSFNGEKLKVDATLEVGDIEIGAVEIKDGTTDARAVVGADGLHVDVRNTNRLVGFDKNANITTTIVTAGVIKTITKTDGVRTQTITIDSTDPNNKSITSIWS